MAAGGEGVTVSVVLPVYNKAPFLRECIDSILEQSFTDFELVAVDDHSTDESLSILSAVGDPRLRIIALEHNLGPAGCAQRGFDAARGRYIVRMDADDVMMPHRVATQVAFMDEHPDIGASGSHMRLLDSPSERWRASLLDVDIRASVLFQIPIFQPSSIYRRSVLVDHSVRFDDEWPRVGEDWLFQLRLLKVTRLANIDDDLVYYRLGPQNSSQGRDRASDLGRLFNEVLRWYGFPNDPVSLHHHLHGLRFYGQGFSTKDVAGLRNYLDGLRDQVHRRGLFDEAAFGRRVDGIWDDLAYQLPRLGWGALWAYLRWDRSPSVAKFRYLLSSFITGRIYAGRG
ncbi:MAG: glycosyltransferase family 2 protein [Flavobacteriales bacterium]|jgi:glycosyltransferase involved in cell wall biosynthesis